MPVLSTLGAAIANVYGFTSGLIKDQYFNLVSLLLPGNGTNGAQNNTFLDSSGNTFTITRNGNTTQGTFSPFSQTGWGAYFDGSNDYVSMPDSTAFTMGSGDFTIECWVYKTTSGRQYITGQSDSTASSGSASFELSVNASNKLVGSVTVSTTTYSATSTVDFPLNTWKHVAFVRNSGTTRLYIGGEQDGTNATLSTNSINDSANQVAIGRLGEYNGLYWNGYISNFRITKGGCLYPNGTTFTPSITPLTTTVSSGTVSLLTCQNNRFIDNAATPNTLTANNGVAITPFSPFAPTQSYSAAAVGGSGYFDGTGDYLDVANNAALQLGTSDFTLETWAYLIDQAGTKNHMAVSKQNYYLYYQEFDSKWVFETNLGSISSSSAWPMSTWQHIAATRSGNTFTLWVNGTSQGTLTNSGSVTDAGGLMNIGRNVANSDNFVLGYLSNTRLVKGTAVYTGAFTPPSLQPLTNAGSTSAAAYPSTTNVNTSFASSACSLLLNFTNAGVVDATAKNVLETVGNAQISTTQSKWGGGSIYFDGTGSPADYLSFPDSPTIRLGSSDFVFECWARFDDFSSTRTICFLNGNSSTLAALRLYVGTDSKIALLMSKAPPAWDVNSGAIGSALSTNTWYYIAVQRSSAGVKVFLDGTQIGSTYSLTGSLMTGTYNYIGDITSTPQPMKGYMDDVRLTLYARTITASPSAPFPVQ